MHLRLYLVKENITQVEFANRIEYHVIYLRDIIAGRRNPGKRLIKAIVQATNGEVTEEDLKVKK